VTKPTYWRATSRDYFVDIVGGCNLRCPSCGNGNMPGAGRPAGMMSLELFDRVLDKIALETETGEPAVVALFNWGEPLLHPRAAEMITRVRSRGFTCCISTNLNRPRDLEGVVRAQPDWFRISVSGFRQEIYQRTHLGGEIERVKQNMHRLRELMDAHRARFPVHVYYHVYRHNVRGDEEAMRQLAAQLGFAFEAVWAVPAPIEKVQGWLTDGVPAQDAPLVELLVIRPEEARELTLGFAEGRQSCPLIDATIVNCDGSVDLCCGTYQQQIARSFLDVQADALRRTKQGWPTCEPCMSNGLHLVGIYAPREAWDRRALDNLEVELGGSDRV
jgi:pyruvate-formate lyase-activating enzyme